MSTAVYCVILNSTYPGGDKSFLTGGTAEHSVPGVSASRSALPWAGAGSVPAAVAEGCVRGLQAGCGLSAVFSQGELASQLPLLSSGLLIPHHKVPKNFHLVLARRKHVVPDPGMGFVFGVEQLQLNSAVWPGAPGSSHPLLTVLCMQSHTGLKNFYFFNTGVEICVCSVCACQCPGLWEARGVGFQSAQEEKALKPRSLTS